MIFFCLLELHYNVEKADAANTWKVLRPFQIHFTSFVHLNSANKTFLPLLDAPKFTSVSVRPSAEIPEGGSVTLSCSSDANPAANYTWYKGNRALFNGAIFRFTSIGSVDSGNYHCKSENQYGAVNSTSVFIDVQCEYEASACSSCFTVHSL